MGNFVTNPSIYKFLLITLIFSAVNLNLVLANSISPKAQTVESTSNQKITSIGIDPAIIEIILEPGVSSKRDVRLSNLTNFAIPIKAIKQGLSPNEKSKIEPQDIQRFDASSWIKMSDDDIDFIMQPNEVKTIEINIFQPSDASPGGHYSTIYFQPLIPTEFVQERSVYIYSRIAVLVFMQVKGEINELINIEKLDVNLLNPSAPIDLKILLKNTGNTHVLPTIKFDLYNSLTSQKIKTINANPSILLPGITKEYLTTLEDNLPMGLYRVTAEVVYGANSEVIKSGNTNFLVMPYSIALIVLISFLIALVLRKRLYKAFQVLIFHKNPLKTKKKTTKKLRPKLIKRVDL